MELLIDHVSKRFKDKKSVNDISLELTPGGLGSAGGQQSGQDHSDADDRRDHAAHFRPSGI